MQFAHLLAFNLTLLAAMAVPGPALLYALKMAISRGRRAGMAAGAGLGMVAAGWTGAALLGLDAAFRLFPWAFVGLKVAGALYLLYIAWTMWRDARTPVAEPTMPAHRAFVGGMLVNLANPKSVLFAASVLIVIFPPTLTLVEKGAVVLNHLAVEVVVYGLFAALLSTRTARTGYLRAKPLIDRLAAAVLGALGLRLLLDR
ncbi:L-lysine permease [Rhodovulum sp. P5]|uniref:LysE family translocator n=1 Tax=Rhodovulum sp. P5 TaxID=1564506 RepID=UPI0009C30B5E|nr:LysE family translocator [Rhodovulum sp. P5]ARE39632.1 L-lysine permease [Rhodovulum sp. P5]